LATTVAQSAPPDNEHAQSSNPVPATGLYRTAIRSRSGPLPSVSRDYTLFAHNLLTQFAHTDCCRIWLYEIKVPPTATRTWLSHRLTHPARLVRLRLLRAAWRPCSRGPEQPAAEGQVGGVTLAADSRIAGRVSTAVAEACRSWTWSRRHSPDQVVRHPPRPLGHTDSYGQGSW
jgi:hypothetical protein